MRSPKRTALLVLLVACLGAAGCGSDEEGAPIPAQQAQELENRLAEVQRRFDVGTGACADIQNDSVPGIEAILNSLPGDVDPDIRDALQDGFDRLFSLSAEQCQEGPEQTETESVQPEPEPEPTTPPETVPPPIDTTPTDTTEQPTTPTVPDVPSDDGSGDEEGGGIVAPGGDGG